MAKRGGFEASNLPNSIVTMPIDIKFHKKIKTLLLPKAVQLHA